MYKNGVASLKTAGAFTIDDQFDISAFAALLLLFLYLLWGSVIFFLSEEWSPLESFYFVFISLTTIGFGDYVPQVFFHLYKFASLQILFDSFCIAAPIGSSNLCCLHNIWVSPHWTVP